MCMCMCTRTEARTTCTLHNMHACTCTCNHVACMHRHTHTTYVRTGADDGLLALLAVAHRHVGEGLRGERLGRGRASLENREQRRYAVRSDERSLMRGIGVDRGDRGDSLLLNLGAARLEEPDKWQDRPAFDHTGLKLGLAAHEVVESRSGQPLRPLTADVENADEWWHAARVEEGLLMFTVVLRGQRVNHPGGHLLGLRVPIGRLLHERRDEARDATAVDHVLIGDAATALAYATTATWSKTVRSGGCNRYA